MYRVTRMASIFLCLLIVAGCGKKDNAEATSTNEKVTEANTISIEAKSDEIKRTCAIKAKPLCAYTTDSYSGNACEDTLWMGYCFNVLVDMGVLPNKVDLSHSDEILDGSIKYGLVDENVREVVNLVKSNSNICSKHAASQGDFDAFAARFKEVVRTMNNVNSARSSCFNDLSSQK